MIRLDPLPAFNFYITLIEDPNNPLDVAKAVASTLLGGFSECTGLESEIQIEESKEGTLPKQISCDTPRRSKSKSKPKIH